MAEYSKLNVQKVRQLAKFKIDYSKVRILEYIDKEKRMPGSFKDFIRIFPKVTFETQEVPRPTFPIDLRYLQDYSTTHYPKGKMIVAVNWDLYSLISTHVDQYVVDVSNDGYYATVYRVKGGKAQDLRDFLKSRLPIIGALFIGALPVAWFEMDDDFHNTRSEFPSDLYYMDLNGTWTDVDADGKFNEHSSDVQPEIWLGRLWTPTEGGNDAELISDYFRRNHEFRKGLRGYSRTALAYVDDDWQHFDDCAFDLMFPSSSIEVIKDPATTDGDRYKAEINQHRGWAQICAHSSPFGHSFSIPSGSEWVPNIYLRDTNPPNAFFYNIFACSNARFTETDYMTGWYIFSAPSFHIFDAAVIPRTNGLAAVGSTKTGSMLYFENFYGPMADGKVIGESYKDWWSALGTDHDLYEKRWFYGLVLLGDPTINWWSGVVPILRDPEDNETFDHCPRKTNFRWDSIDIPGATYSIEIDAFGAVSPDKWAAEIGQTGFVQLGLAENRYEYDFVGAQRGRWRVRARVANLDCPWSDWRYFRYTK